MNFNSLKVSVTSARQVDTTVKANDQGTRANMLAGFCEVSVAIDDGTPEGTTLFKQLAGRINLSKSKNSDEVQPYVSFNHSDSNGGFNNILVAIDSDFQNFLQGKVIEHIATHGWTSSTNIHDRVAAATGKSVEEIKNFTNQAFGAAIGKVSSYSMPVASVTNKTDAQVLADLTGDSASGFAA